MTEIKTEKPTIVCPDWCCHTPEKHAADDWFVWDGLCLHATRPPRGPEPVVFYSSTTPDGEEVAPPSLSVDGGEYTVERALELAASITKYIAAYRDAQSS